MVADVRATVLHNLPQRQLEGVIPARLHEGRRPHKGVAHGVWGEVTGDVMGKVRL